MKKEYSVVLTLDELSLICATLSVLCQKIGDNAGDNADDTDRLMTDIAKRVISKLLSA